MAKKNNNGCCGGPDSSEALFQTMLKARIDRGDFPAASPLVAMGPGLVAAADPSLARRAKVAKSPIPDSMLDANDGRWPGGKSAAGTVEWICNLLPPHVLYCEPFAGKAGVFRRKRPAMRSLLIDLDKDVVTWLHRQGRRYEIPTRASPRMAMTAAVDFLAGGESKGSQSVMAIVGCGIGFVELVADQQLLDLLIYLDPPYLPETRRRTKLYRFEMTRADHVRLLKAVIAVPGPVVISGYESDLYLKTLAGWRLHQRVVMTRGGSRRRECLWINRTADDLVSSFAMDYSELGFGFRERARVGKKVRRWTDNFAKLPDRERRAILLALLDADRGGMAVENEQ